MPAGPLSEALGKVGTRPASPEPIKTRLPTFFLLGPDPQPALEEASSRNYDLKSFWELLLPVRSRTLTVASHLLCASEKRFETWISVTLG